MKWSSILFLVCASAFLVGFAVWREGEVWIRVTLGVARNEMGIETLPEWVSLMRPGRRYIRTLTGNFAPVV